eukprot:scaffold53709_cov19-Tisochrysis_lutea.AAC.1
MAMTYDKAFGVGVAEANNARLEQQIRQQINLSTKKHASTSSQKMETLKDDGLSMDDVYALIKRFPKQPLDFFGALRASQYDNQIRAWIEREVLGGRLGRGMLVSFRWSEYGGQSLSHESSNMAVISQRLIQQTDLPKFEPMQLTLQEMMQQRQREPWTPAALFLVFESFVLHTAQHVDRSVVHSSHASRPPAAPLEGSSGV